MISKGLVKFGELVDCVVSNKCFSDKQDGIGPIYSNQLGEGAHQRLVILKLAHVATRKCEREKPAYARQYQSDKHRSPGRAQRIWRA